MEEPTSFRAADNIQIVSNPEPAKLIGQATLTPAELKNLAQLGIKSLASYSDDSRGTCGDERAREGLLNGDKTVEARPSAWGGPNIYGLFMAELSGYFTDSKLDGRGRLQAVTGIINDANIKSGGHVGCAANGSLPDILAILAKPSNWNAAVKDELGNEYDDELAVSLASNAQKALDSHAYAGWTETILQEVLGDEAGVAIETLQPGPHTARVLKRIWIAGQTVDQTTLAKNANGETSFVQDEPYCQRIERAISGDDESKMPILRHAREALLQAVLLAVPNPELWQTSLR